MSKSKKTIKLGDLIRELLNETKELNDWKEMYREEWEEKNPNRNRIERYLWWINECEEEIEKIYNQLNKFKIEV